MSIVHARVEQVPFVKSEDIYIPLYPEYKKYPTNKIQEWFDLSPDIDLIIASMKIVKNRVIKEIVYSSSNEKEIKMIANKAYIKVRNGSVRYRSMIERIAPLVPSINREALLVIFSACDLHIMEHVREEYLIPVPFEIGEATIIVESINNITKNNSAVVFVNGKETELGLFDVSKNEIVEEVVAPKDSEFFYIDQSVNSVLTFAYHHSIQNGYANILFVGASGTGKSSVAKKFADKIGAKFLKYDLSLATEPTDFLGTTILKNGSTEFQTTPFVQAIEEGGWVILLDEINRCYPNVSNPLLALMDDSHSLTYMNRRYVVSPGTIFIVSANIGSLYTGTFTADEALMNRMHASVNMTHMPAQNEISVLYNRVSGLTMEHAKSIVKFLHEARQLETDVDFSVRSGLSIAHAVALGYSLRSAAMMVFGRVPLETLKEIQDILGKQGHKENNTPKLLF